MRQAPLFNTNEFTYHSLAVPDPPAGNWLVFSGQQPLIYRPISIYTAFIADANPANRYIQVIIHHNLNDIARYLFPAPITAGTTCALHLGVNQQFSSTLVPFPYQTGPLPADLFTDQTTFITFAVFNQQAGDQFTTSAWYFHQWTLI